MISDYQDIAEYIRKNYKTKVVEVGIGSLPQVAIALKDSLDVIVTDVVELKYTEVHSVIDDIFSPDIEIYQDASLIYSIRPPVDIQEAIARVAKEVGADLLIRPFGNEKADLRKFFKKCTLLNYKKARFYLYMAGESSPV
ncbi:MAG: hypothetical protein J5U17_09290 [Candidatus Methanoperedens sp.]|nr:hypothetical protein [Candidatus Methanoperedens sp.]MCE8425954.1 hypothetical protein [Candidatus Methanoperedens sp.]MCE8427383.1 hypothetical protein [Candidatus Methanoperedens sp.]